MVGKYTVFTGWVLLKMIFWRLSRNSLIKIILEMFKMKANKLLLTSLIVATIGLGGAVYAEPGHGGKGKGCYDKHHGGKYHGDKQGKSAKNSVNRMVKKLDLSDAQTQQLTSLMEANKSSMQPLRDQMRTVKKTLRQLDPSLANFSSELTRLAGQQADLTRQIAVARGNNRQKMFAILTPEQQVKMKEMQEKRMQKRMERGDKNRH